jgi:hypothetical protein
MRKVFQAIRGGTVAFLGWLSFVVLTPGRDLIVTARGDITDLHGTPPHWLAVENEPRIIQGLFATILFMLILLFSWSWLEFIVTRALRQIWLVKNIDQIFRKIPQNLIRTDGRWEKVDFQITSVLSKFVNRPAEMIISVNRVESSPSGRYRLIARIAAIAPTDQRTGLPVWTHAYFDNASLEQIRRMRDCGPHDKVNISGIISRADIEKQPNEWTLNLDLHSCVITN